MIGNPAIFVNASYSRTRAATENAFIVRSTKFRRANALLIAYTKIEGTYTKRSII